MRLRRFLTSVVLIIGITYLIGIYASNAHPLQPETHTMTISTTSDTIMTAAQRRATLHAVRTMQVKNAVRLADVRAQYEKMVLLSAWLAAEQAQQNAAAVEKRSKRASATGVGPQPTTSNAATVAAPSDLAGVMQCIKNHESGDYNEHSHIYDGSGAYQIIPGTFRAWSARAGYGGYAFAYEAPPSVQDAVVIYMLRNGGAHNWDPKYGNDPCTVGLP